MAGIQKARVKNPLDYFCHESTKTQKSFFLSVLALLLFMNRKMTGAQNKIRNAVSEWSGVTIHPHRFGGIEFRLGKRELGHIHGDSLLDIPFPMPIRNKLIHSRRVQPHHILPESGWVSFYIKTENDIQEGIELLRLSFDNAQKSQRNALQHRNLPTINEQNKK